MRLVMAILLLAPTGALAEDFDKQLVSGVVMVHIQVPAVTTGGVVASVGLRREDTKELVFCALLTTGGRIDEPSEPIVNRGAPVFLSASGFDAPECVGHESAPSTNRYRATFGPPGQVLLLEPVPSVTEETENDPTD